MLIKTKRTATRSRRRPGNAHVISIRQVSANAATLRCLRCLLLLNAAAAAAAALGSSLIRS